MSSTLFKGDNPLTSKAEFITFKEAVFTELQYNRIEYVMRSDTLHAEGRFPDPKKEKPPINVVELFTDEEKSKLTLEQINSRYTIWLQGEDVRLAALSMYEARKILGEGDLCKAYSIIKRLVHPDPCKARSIIQSHARKECKERLHGMWSEFLLYYDEASNMLSLTDCMDTLKYATSDRHTVHSRHAIYLSTIASMEERKIPFDLKSITRLFVDGMKDQALRALVIIPWQQRCIRYSCELHVKSTDKDFQMTETTEPSETWFQLSNSICSAVDLNPDMDTGPPKPAPVEEPETRASVSRPVPANTPSQLVNIDDRPCWICGVLGHQMASCEATHCNDCMVKLPANRAKHRGALCPVRRNAGKPPATKSKRPAPQSIAPKTAKKPRPGHTSKTATEKNINEVSEQLKILTAMLLKQATSSSTKGA